MAALGLSNISGQLEDQPGAFPTLIVGIARCGRRLAGAVLVGQHRDQTSHLSRRQTVEEAIAQRQHRQQICFMKDRPQALA